MCCTCFIIAAGLLAEAFVRDRLIVPTDAATTAGNIAAHRLLFRLGIAADLTTFVLAVPVTMILYSVFRTVNKNMALLMVFSIWCRMPLEASTR